MSEPVHPQLMDPIYDPEEFIVASIYWYPTLFITRTEVLDHTLLCNGNGYGWGSDGRIRSVFSHIEPDRDRLDRYEVQARVYEAEARGTRDETLRILLLEWAVNERESHRALLTVRADCRNLARTYGPVRTTIDYGPANGGKVARMVTSSELAWTLLGRVPQYVDPAWQRIIDEVRDLFAPILVEQGTLWS